jgi:predicted GNAT family acetyltransferase
MSRTSAEPSVDDLSDLEVVEVAELGRYEARVGGRRVGVADYLVAGERVVFSHTEVEPALEGHGIASRLARRALDDARQRGLRVVPACSFFRVYLRRHPEDADLLA